jgi:hypothetical protein
VDLALADNDTEGVWDSTESDAEGFFRLFGPYGAILAHNNLPVDGVPSARDQYSGSPPTPTYTATGLLFAAHWIQGTRLTGDKDAENFLLLSEGGARRLFPVFTRYPNWYDFGGAAGNGLDLAQHPSGWLLRARRDGSDIVVERSLNAGVTWPDTETVGSDAGEDAAPALLVTRRGETYLAYHTSADAARLWRSDEAGESGSWQSVATHAGRVFPRLGELPGRLLLLYQDSGNLKAAQSDDGGATFAAATDLGAADPGPVGLIVDRHARPHVLYASGDALMLRRADSGAAEWETAVSLGASPAALPAFAAGLRAALLSWWEGETPKLAVTDETYGAIERSLSAPSGAWEPAAVGLLFDARDEAYWLGLLSGAAAVRYSGDEGESWQAPA